MRMPFAWIAVSFTLGIVTGFYFSLPHVFLWSVIFSCVFFLFLFRGQSSFRYFLVGSLFFLGVISSTPFEARDLKIFEPEPAWKHVGVEGTVTGFSKVSIHGKRKRVSFPMEVDRVILVRGSEKKKIPLRGRVQVFILQPDFFPELGDRIRVWGTFRRPKAASNPGGFDYQKFLAQRKIYWLFDGIGRNALRMVPAHPKPLFLKGVLCAREFFRKGIEKFFRGESSAFFKALILGERSNLSGDLNSDFIKTGTSQVLPTAIRKWDHNPLASYFTAQAISHLL